ncbi:MAG TPA: hypothetical protein VG944_09645, partial [Fimbriimonas sp.]|nr:hypothetical protein [Fimbriimonas sp.]
NDMISSLGYTAAFRRKYVEPRDSRPRATFFVHWREPSAKAPPTQFLKMIEESFEVESFEITSESEG